MLEVMRRWDELQPRVLRLINRLGASQESLKLLSPLDQPGKILCVGLNYRDHAAESNMPIPTEPIFFCKVESSLCGPEDPIYLPPMCKQVDYEAELVIVVGSKIYRATEEEAKNSIFGYSVGHDVSARDWQLEKPGKQWFLGKSFKNFAPIGPGITISSTVPNPMNLAIELKLNGTIMQSSNTREMVFGPVELIKYVTQVMPLEPGDIIFTGTPPGVGMARSPQVFLKDGDQVEITIEGLGSISNRCSVEPC